MVGRAYYDLGVSDTQLEPSTQKERVAVALALGYDGVALVHQASAKLASTDKSVPPALFCLGFFFM